MSYNNSYFIPKKKFVDVKKPMHLCFSYKKWSPRIFNKRIYTIETLYIIILIKEKDFIKILQLCQKMPFVQDIEWKSLNTRVSEKERERERWEPGKKLQPVDFFIQFLVYEQCLTHFLHTH
jgi:hypothetical protein